LALETEVQFGGRRLALKAVDPGQVIESQHYVFPQEVVDHAVDVTAAAPGIEQSWLASGLVRQLVARHAPPEGRGHLPVAIVSTYLAGGEIHQDRSLYLVGYVWRRRFLRAPEISLQGLAFRGRLPAADPQAVVEKAWAAGG
jgi:hypothetical protein